MISSDYLNECFIYNKDTGILIWKDRPRGHFNTDRGHKTFLSQKYGKETGCVSTTSCGMSYIKVAINKKLYLAHRIIWIMVNGDIPDGFEIDHIDHDGTNNSINNLRLVCSSDNKKNRTKVKTNKSGCMGVYFNRRINKWVAEIVSKGDHIGLGSYSDKNDAIEARRKAEIKFKFHNNHGGDKIVIG